MTQNSSRTDLRFAALATSAMALINRGDAAFTLLSRDAITGDAIERAKDRWAKAVEAYYEAFDTAMVASPDQPPPEQRVTVTLKLDPETFRDAVRGIVGLAESWEVPQAGDGK